LSFEDDADEEERDDEFDDVDVGKEEQQEYPIIFHLG
jgi:hypothetical protein